MPDSVGTQRSEARRAIGKPCGHVGHVGTCASCQRTQLARWRRTAGSGLVESEVAMIRTLYAAVQQRCWRRDRSRRIAAMLERERGDRNGRPRPARGDGVAAGRDSRASRGGWSHNGESYTRGRALSHPLQCVPWTTLRWTIPGSDPGSSHVVLVHKPKRTETVAYPGAGPVGDLPRSCKRRSASGLDDRERRLPGLSDPRRRRGNPLRACRHRRYPSCPEAALRSRAKAPARQPRVHDCGSEFSGTGASFSRIALAAG